MGKLGSGFSLSKTRCVFDSLFSAVALLTAKPRSCKSPAQVCFYNEQEPPAGTDATGYDGKYWRWADGRPLIWEK